MSNFINHAKREFLAVGYIPLDQDQEDGPNKWIQENILELPKNWNDFLTASKKLTKIHLEKCRQNFFWRNPGKPKLCD